MRFYRITSDSISDEEWMYAFRIIPPLRSIGRSCPTCGKGKIYPSWYPELPLEFNAEGGIGQPDILLVGAYPLLAISGNTIKLWQNNNVTGFEAYSFSLHNDSTHLPSNQTHEQYYHLKINGGCQLDYEAMGMKVTFFCPNCKYVKTDPLFFDTFVINDASWDGSDLFVDEMFPFVTFCSERLMRIVQDAGLTNFRFLDPQASPLKEFEEFMRN